MAVGLENIQFVFIDDKSTTEPIFALSILQDNLIFVDLEKANNRVSRDLIWRAL